MSKRRDIWRRERFMRHANSVGHLIHAEFWATMREAGVDPWDAEAMRRSLSRAGREAGEAVRRNVKDEGR